MGARLTHHLPEMDMHVYDLTVPQLINILGQIKRWLEKAQAHADAKKFDAKVLLSARLAPDQFHLTRQIQTACDNAKNLSARLAGVEPPRFEDTEATLEELHGRIDRTIAWLSTLSREQFEGAEERRIVLPFMPGKHMIGAEYLVQFALPNFYFHAATAYAVLRHNGVDLGKTDFLGQVNLREG
jgi:hypothetical protein